MSTSSEETLELAVGAEKCSEVEPQAKAGGEEVTKPQEEQNDDEARSFCRVSVTYSSETATELQLEEGDIVEVLSKRADGWWTGILREKVGLFPSNFVEPISAHQARTDENLKYCKVLFDCQAELPDELDLRENDVLEVISKCSDGWWRGRIGDQVGMFPSNFVTMISTPTTTTTSTTTSTSSGTSCSPDAAQVVRVDRSPSTSTSTSTTLASTTDTNCSAYAAQADTVILSQCQVVVPFPGNDDDELTLEDGDIITIVSKDVRDDGLWWKGVLRGKTGIFPKFFVKEVEATATTEATGNNESHTTDVPVIIEESIEVEEQNLENSALSSTGTSCNVPEPADAVPVGLPVSTDNTETTPQCRVTAPYESAQEDELTLVEGDVIIIISKEGHWWKGTLNGKTGLFPKSFVEEIMSASTETDQTERFSEESLKRLLEQEIMEKLKIENEDKKKCLICMDCDINSAFFPCGHITCCAGCAPKNDICPLCRVAIERTERIYLPG